MTIKLPVVTVNLEKVMLSFPYLIEKEPIGKYVQSEEKRKYSAVFLLAKDSENHMKMVKEFNDKFAKLMIDAKLKVNAHDLIKDGDEEWEAIDDSTPEGKERKEKNEYKKGHFLIKAANKYQPILTTFKNAEPFDMVKHKELFRPFSYVHAVVELHPYMVDPKTDTKFKAICNRLHAVQFSKEGKAFGGVKLISGGAEFEKFAEDDEKEDDNADFGKFKQGSDISDKDLF